MKKYLIAILSIVVLFFLYQFLVYDQGVYIKLSHDPITSHFITADKQIYHIENNQKELFVVKGVLINGFLPGSNRSDYAVEKNQYTMWLKQIQEMGANTVKVNGIMDQDFYDALYEYNTKAKEPLYLLQGLSVSEYAQNNQQDAYDAGFLGSLKKDAQSIVDIIHGKKTILLNRGAGQGVYRKDISKWVLGIVVGNDWNVDTIAYTNARVHKTGYTGKYISTTKEASSFECLLAEVMDHIMNYESDKYDTQHLISFNNSSSSDPFLYTENYALQMHKIITLDAQHIKASKDVKSGYFATYHIADMPNGVLDNIESTDVKSLINTVDTSTYNHGYIKLLNDYHTMPLVIGDFGLSTSRGIESEAMLKENGGPLNEQAQGEELVRIYQEYLKNGWAGAVINSWEDDWGKHTWNTSFAKDVNHASLWSDIQTSDTGYGLISFDPKHNQFHCDGKLNEWKERNKISEQNGLSLYMQSDFRYLYMMVKGDSLTSDRTLYIPIDITSKSGIKQLNNPSMKMNRPADFLLQLHGDDDSRLLVDPYYHAMRENYEKEVSGKDPFVEIPSKHSGAFQKIDMILSRSGIIADFANTPTFERLAPTFETGKLHAGNSNPKSSVYDSQADFKYGDGFVEVRIPWLLLNFSNPADQKVHDDYYEHYGVQEIDCKKIYVGAMFADNPDAVIQMKAYTKSKWDSVDYQERLKKSYDILQKAWKEDE